MNGSSEHRITRFIFIVSFHVSTIILVALAVKQPVRSGVIAAVVSAFILAIGAAILRILKGRQSILMRIILLVSVLNLIIVPPEAYLRYTWFRYESGIQFGYPRPHQFSPFVPDERLFWKFPPSRPEINAYGFQTREVKKPKPPETFRILYIGNSCTHQGIPQRVEVMLRRQHPQIECLNFAIPGYTSYQGKVVIDLYLDEIDPDLVVASFGWNDRWLAYGAVDEEKIIKISHGVASRIIGVVYSRWRLLQLFRKLLSPVLGHNQPLDVNRVSIDRFSFNLRAIGGACSARGIPVIFATEPSSHPTLGVPDYLVESNYAKTKEASIVLYREYNAAVRDLAGGSDGWHLIDLDAEVSDRADVGDLFKNDGLHFSERGLELVAGIESSYIEKYILGQD